MIAIGNLLNGIFYSFPVQLVLLGLKKHFLLLTFWLLLFGFVTENLGSKYGFHYLFFEPEYMGEVNFLSFLILGAATGGFFVTWNITSYILNAYRFPFLATLSRPFVKYTFNNFLIPLLFFLTYIVCIYQFQLREQVPYSDILSRFFGLAAGFVLVTMISFAYFFRTNANLSKILGLGNLDKEVDYKKVNTDADISLQKAFLLEKGWRVDTYLYSFNKARPVRSTEHYDGELLKRVFFQNHVNALIVESIAFFILIALGYLTDISWFRIPAAASFLLFFAITMMFIGALGFWLRGWRTFSFLVIMLGLNFLMMSEVFDFKHMAYGMNYDTVSEYNYSVLQDHTSGYNLIKDRARTLEILKNWKNKFEGQEEKPKMIFLNVSGGGLRSAVFSMEVLRKLNKNLNGDLMKNVILITGASGGMLGAAYYRELTLRAQQGEIPSADDHKHIDEMSKDLLNALSLTLATNDLFNPFQKVEIEGNTYSIDRGLAFEKQLHENTNYYLDKSIDDYEVPEYNSEIPMMFLTPVIMNDGRNMIISPQDISFMCKPTLRESKNYEAEVEGVEYKKLFAENDAGALRFSTALRMNATFPYVTPNVHLPSDPVIEMTDAGMRDNFGTTYATKFLYNFKEWIKENTSGVIFLQIRDTGKRYLDQEDHRPSLMGRVFYPIGNFFSNWQKFQDYQSDNLLGSTINWFEGKVDVVSFQYTTDKRRRKASLSWHLTKKEKSLIRENLNSSLNENSTNKMMQLMGYNYSEVKN